MMLVYYKLLVILRKALLNNGKNYEETADVVKRFVGNTKANVQDFCFLENDPHNFIDASFNWKNSAEGPSFWFEIHDIFVNYYCNMEAK